jgi:imidazole glycerol-phosphate synthase subunit HisH
VIAVVDYGIGNLGSIANMVKHVGGTAQLTGDAGVLREARAIVVPGVGSFDACMIALRRSGLVDTIETRVFEEALPVMGICVGMQMMARGSEEGQQSGLGWIAADVRYLPAGPGVKVPHVGWSALNPRPGNPLFVGADPDQRFYFVHSFHMVCDDPADIAGIGFHGGPFTAAVTRGNLFGVQFHPEKSHRFGMKVFENFLRHVGEPPRHPYDAV